MIIPQETIFNKKKLNVKISTYMDLKNAAHWHNEMEFILVTSGKINVTINKKMYTGVVGDCFLCENGDVHSITGENGSVVDIMQFSESIIGDKKYRIAAPYIENTPNVSEIFRTIISEMTKSDAFHISYIHNIIENMIIDIYRNNEIIKQNSYDMVDTLTEYKKLIEYINTSFATVTFDEASKIMSFTPSYFSKIFADLSGMTFSKYLNIIKIEKSIAMIQTSKKSIAEIAMDCGFGSIRHYNRVFKNLTGYSPKSIPKNYEFNQYPVKISSNNYNPTQTDVKILAEYV